MGWLRDPAPGAGAVAGARVGARPGTDFRYRAACRSVDPEVFFPTAVRGAVFAVQVAAAKAVCAGCPVQ
ncbi:MAG: WhiB family transcriptional regulator, partial [Pseudonocardia sp.]